MEVWKFAFRGAGKGQSVELDVGRRGPRADDLQGLLVNKAPVLLRALSIHRSMRAADMRQWSTAKGREAQR